MKRRADDLERGESGHSLVEAAVSMALLVTVLVPLAGGLAELLHRQGQARDLVAWTVAQAVMEDLLYHDHFTAQATDTTAGPWRVRGRIEHRGRQAVFWVEVYERTDPFPQLSLMTIRLNLLSVAFPDTCVGKETIP